MLYTNTYVPHPIEKMQAFIAFIFFQVWCKKPQDYLATLKRQAKTNLLAEINFLKEPFWEACQRAGLF